MHRLLFSFFILGLSFGIGPCLASCGPLLISYAAGTQKNIIKSAWVYLIFSLSRILVYIALGLIIFLFGQMAIRYTLGAVSRYLFIFGGLFIVIIGLLIIFNKRLDYKICRKLQTFLLKKDTKTVIMLGFIAGILPCAPLISVVSYIGLISRNWLISLLCSLFFGLGTMLSPLFILVIFTSTITKAFMNREEIYRIFNFVCGLVIVFLGLQLIRKAFYV